MALAIFKSVVLAVLLVSVSWVSADDTDGSEPALERHVRDVGGKVLAGGIVAKGIGEHAVGTALLAGPAVAANAKVAAGAAALPAVLAAKGALVGKAIAAPIIKGAAINSFIAAKIAGKLVAIPVAIKTGAKLAALKAALFKKGIILKGKKIAIKVAAGAKALKLALLKPLVIGEGLKLKALGAGAGLAGKAMKAQGALLLAKGAATELGALKLKGAGASLIGLGLGGPKLVKGALAGAAGAAGAAAGAPVIAALAGGHGDKLNVQNLVVGPLTSILPSQLIGKFHTVEGLFAGASPDLISKLNVIRNTLPHTGGKLVAGPAVAPPTNYASAAAGGAQSSGHY